MTDTNRKALDIQERFEFYFVSLTFTLLALAIQSAPPNELWAVSLVEVVGWAVLLVSGLVQLFRLQLIPVTLRYEAAKKSQLSINQQDADKVSSRIGTSYKLSWWSFIVGVVLVSAARAFVHLN